MTSLHFVDTVSVYVFHGYTVVGPVISLDRRMKPELPLLLVLLHHPSMLDQLLPSRLLPRVGIPSRALKIQNPNLGAM